MGPYPPGTPVAEIYQPCQYHQPSRHRHEDEYSFVLQGRVGLQLGDEAFEAMPGDLIRKAARRLPRLLERRRRPARLLELISPAGFDEYFRELVPLLSAPERDDDAIGSVVARHGLEIDFGTIPVLVERYGLQTA